MLPLARHSAILKAVTARGSCSVAELASELEVSGETIRRDIKQMDVSAFQSGKPGHFSFM